MQTTSHVDALELQGLLAKLVTNPSVAGNLLSTRDPEAAGLSLPSETRTVLLDFLVEHGAAFRASVLMLKKRRLDNILESLGVVSRLYSEYELSCLWDDYLASLAFDAAVPKNPLLESIHFCSYLLRTLQSDDRHRALVLYDRTRNEVTAAVASDPKSYLQCALGETTSIGDSHVPFIHPCSRLVQFDCNVSALVKLLTSGQTRTRIISAWTPTQERIVFFKNWQKGGVGSLRVNDQVSDVLTLANGEHTVGELLSVHKLQETQRPRLINLLDTLRSAGVLILMSDKGMQP